MHTAMVYVIQVTVTVCDQLSANLYDLYHCYCYAANSGKFFPTYMDNLSIISTRRGFQMGPMGCP